MDLPPPPDVDSVGWKDWLFRFYKLVLAGSFDGVLNALLDLSGASAGQIKFPATQNPSADANTLDDYEEGTWTPTITAGSGTFTTVSASGTYTKIGDRVFIRFAVVITTNGTAAGRVKASLPFNPAEITALSGSETAVTGFGLSTYVNTGDNLCQIFKYDASYPGASGNTLSVAGEYRV